jgi:hypothetical protein
VTPSQGLKPVQMWSFGSSSCPYIMQDSKVESIGFFALLGRLRFLSFKQGELRWRQGAETAVWSQVIIVVTPPIDGLPRFGQAQE